MGTRPRTKKHIQEAVVALTVAGVLGFRWWKQAKARQGPRPRSPVSWLRTFGRNASRTSANAH